MGSDGRDNGDRPLLHLPHPGVAPGVWTRAGRRAVALVVGASHNSASVGAGEKLDLAPRRIGHADSLFRLPHAHGAHRADRWLVRPMLRRWGAVSVGAERWDGKGATGETTRGGGGMPECEPTPSRQTVWRRNRERAGNPVRDYQKRKDRGIFNDATLHRTYKNI